MKLPIRFRPMSKATRRSLGHCLLISAAAGCLMGMSTVKTMRAQTQAPSMAIASFAEPLAATDYATPADERGRAWAAQAFPVGLRDCPAASEAFVAACEAEMKELAAAPVVTYRPEPEPRAMAAAYDIWADDPGADVAAEERTPVVVAPPPATYACIGCGSEAVMPADGAAAGPVPAAWRQMAEPGPGQ